MLVPFLPFLSVQQRSVWGLINEYDDDDDDDDDGTIMSIYIATGFCLPLCENCGPEKF